MEHINQKIRVAIDKNNPSIKRIESKCVKCGICFSKCPAKPLAITK